MGGNLRDIVKAHIKEETLRSYLGDRYDSTPEEEKNKFLDYLNDTINRQVENILNEFLIEIQKGSPEVKRKKHSKSFLSLLTMGASIGLALAVNEKNAPFIALSGLAIFAIQTYQIFFD